MLYPIEEREKTRFAVRQLQQYAREAQLAAQTGNPLPTEVANAIITFTGTHDTSRQIDALDALSEDLRRRHVAKLQPLARDDFNAFCEYINPEEPPESAWHIWLTRKLQEIENNPELGRFILNCPPGHAKPLHVDTPVLMNTGHWKRLGDIEVGEWVITDKARPRKVSAVHEQGTLPILKLETKKGRVIRTAFDHSFRVVKADGSFVWKQAQDLRPGDKLHLVNWYDNEALFPASETYDRRDAIVAGFFSAIGSTVPDENGNIVHYRLTTKPERMERLRAAMDDLGIGYNVLPQPRTTRLMMRVYKRDLKQMTSHITQNKSRRIPSWVFGTSNDLVREFLLAFASLQGNLLQSAIPTYRMRLYQYDHAKQMSWLFCRVGIETKMSLSNTAKTYYLDIRGEHLAKFVEMGFHHHRLDYDALSEIESTTEYDRDTVASLSIVEDAECRCLTVDEDHTFLADGIVVHNSTYASRLFVAWRMGRNPTHKVIGGGHSQTFVENEFSAKIRSIVGSPEFGLIFPEVVISSETRAKNQWVLAGKGGQYAARGVGQGVHGFRAHFVCVDDPYAKIEDAESPVVREKVETWFVGDLGSRMLPTGKIFLIMTRFHENDLTGYLLEQNKFLPSYSRWYHVEAPALCIDPETDVLGRKLGEVLWDYYSLQYFLTKKSEWSFQRFSLVYQQRTDAISDGKVTGGFQYYHLLPHQTPEAISKAKLAGQVDEQGRGKPNKREYFRRIITSVDTAQKPGQRNDYTVIQTWGETANRQHYLLAQRRMKGGLPEITLAIEDEAKRHESDIILIEDKGSGTNYIQTRGATPTQRRLAPCPIVAFDPNGQSKEFRYDEVTPIIREGSVHLPARAKWLDRYLKEFGQFPDGAHDDQVDATSQYLLYTRKTGRSRYGTREIGSLG